MTPIIIGPCTLYHADCLDVLPTLAAGSVDCVLTDPPYGMNYQSARCISGPRFNRLDGDANANTEWVKTLPIAHCLVMFCEWKNAEVFRIALESAGWPVRSQLVWDRVSHGMGDVSTVWSPQHDLAWWSCRTGYQFPGSRPVSVMRFQRVSNTAMLHPTQKPIKLMKHIIERVSDQSSTVLDPFMGSGTTGVACIRTGRRFIGIEKDAAYFEVARKRIAAEWERWQGGPMFAETPKKSENLYR